MIKAQWHIKSRIGSLYLVASEYGLEGIFWQAQSAPFVDSLTAPNPEIQILAKAVKQLDEYFSGQRKSFDIPLAPAGTDFQKCVWNELAKIPYGKTVSYYAIAKKIGNHKASRAVGTANGKNPLCIIVPCHRVIAANGSLGGYSGGLEVKSQLLAIENSFKV